MFLERFKEVENFTITKLPLGGSKKFYVFNLMKNILKKFDVMRLTQRKSSPLLIQESYKIMINGTIL